MRRVWEDRRVPSELHPRLSLVIPLYRDEDALERIFARCEPVLDEVEGGGELVLVDDGGFYRTTARALELARAARHPTTVVRLARNFGQHAAVFAGLAHARGTAVATLDSDLQYPPEELPAMLRELSPEYPVVSGYRANRRDPLVRRTITRVLTRWLNRKTGVRLRDFGSMFRIYDRPTVEMMLTFTERHRYVPAIVAWLGIPIKEVPVAHQSRTERGSHYRVGALVEMTLDLVTGYTVFPLRALTTLGLAASLIGFLGTVLLALYRIFVGAGGAGTASAFALVFALLTVQLLIVALIGEYVGRVYSEAKGRPYYVVAAMSHVCDGELSAQPTR
jgi:undecaprenyl-phosphate 4-deoxy-4-formamido-L-arabinose transferase